MKRRERSKNEPALNTKEYRLIELLKYWGFHNAAAFIDLRHIDVDAITASWETYPACMADFPTQLTSK